ncbi:MAG: type IV pilus assembly protein PilM [Candidatus Brocadiae bacterium]|nr:type IV pilus assembly protein PilM [Candidatus Brocadiia bacterium]
MGARSLLGLDIGSTTIKAVELTETRTGAALTGYAYADLPSPSVLPDVLRDLLARARFRARSVATSVSGRSVIVRYVLHPRVSDEELPARIRFEAAKYLPFDPGEAYVDYQRLEEPGAPVAVGAAGAEMRLLLVAARKEVVESHLGLLERLGLIPQVVDVDAFALGNAFELRALTNPGAAGDKAAALLDIGASKTTLAILKPFSSYSFSREIYIAGNEFTEAISRRLEVPLEEAERLKRVPAERGDAVKEALAQPMEDLCQEVRLSFDYFESQHEREVEGIWLSGGGALTPGLDEVIQRVFAKTPRRWDPAEGLEIRKERVGLGELRDFAGQSVIAMGLASRVWKA